MQTIYTTVRGDLSIKVFCQSNSEIYSYWDLKSSYDSSAYDIKTHKEAVQRFFRRMGWNHLEISGHGRGVLESGADYFFKMNIKRKEG